MEITCSFREVYSRSGKYTLEVNSLRNIHPNTKIASFEGQHEEGKSNADVKSLNIWEKDYHWQLRIQFLPVGLLQLFHGLEKLTIHSLTLKEISRRNLAELENLKELSITQCNLTHLPDDLFIDLPELKSVDLGCNQIGSATSKLLKPFTGRTMRLFDLRDNKTINAHYSQDEGSVKSLQELMKIIDEKCCGKTLKTEDCGKTLKTEERKPLFELEKQIRGLWPSGRFFDFEIVVERKRFRVHKNVIGLQSSVLAKVFDDNEQATEMKIPDFSETAVENLLHFMYTGEIKKDSDDLQMFSIASKLDVPNLIKIYERILKEKLKDCNELAAYEVFLCAHQNTSAELKLQAFKAIEKLFARGLPELLMNDPERLKQSIVKKIELDQVLQ